MCCPGPAPGFPRPQLQGRGLASQSLTRCPGASSVQMFSTGGAGWETQKIPAQGSASADGPV